MLASHAINLTISWPNKSHMFGTGSILKYAEGVRQFQPGVRGTRTLGVRFTVTTERVFRIHNQSSYVHALFSYVHALILRRPTQSKARLPGPKPLESNLVRLSRR